MVTPPAGGRRRVRGGGARGASISSADTWGFSCPLSDLLGSLLPLPLVGRRMLVSLTLFRHLLPLLLGRANIP